MSFNNKSRLLIFVFLIIGVNSQGIQKNLNKLKNSYPCTQWSQWNDIEGLKKEILEKYPSIKVNIEQNSDMCQVFNLERFIRDSILPKKSGFKMGIAKAAGLASCLGLTLAIAGALAYSKSNVNDLDENEQEELISNHLESEQS